MSSSSSNATSSNTRLSGANILRAIEASQKRTDLPTFRSGDTVRVHAKIIEGSKERIQIFEGVVIRRNKGDHLTASFTVRKVSYNIGVERTFLLHSPRIDKLEVVTRGSVRRARLYYLRPLRGKAARIRSKNMQQTTEAEISVAASNEGAPANDG